MRIYTRAQWGAQYRDGVGTRPTGRLEKYFHHDAFGTAPGPNATFTQDAAHMRRVESVGQSRFGAGISYNFGISRAGRVLQGASVHRISYHSGDGRNTRGAGIVLFGNYMNLDMSDPQFAALVRLLQHGVEQGWWGDPALTEGHRDFRATSCPGDNAYGRMGAINRAGRSGDVTSPSSPAPKPAPRPSGRSKSVSQMASEVIAGQHGTGHANRRRSLGISQSLYEQVRAEVNRRAGGGSSSRPAGKSVAQMAQEVIDGKHGNGHETRRRSLGITQSRYQQVRAEVNRRAGGGSSSGGGKSISQMATEVIAGKHGNGHATRRRSLGVDAATYAKVRAEVNRRA